MKPSVQIKTFGCKLNHYDSLIMEKHLAGIPISKKVFVLNSCAVTAQAGKDIRKEARRIKSSHPDSLIVLTGCGAQVETELYEQEKSIDLLIGNSDRKNLTSILKEFSTQSSNKENKTFKSNIFKTSEIYSDFVSPSTHRTRAFLKIQDGCDSFCTFCIIPFARGKSKSLPVEFLEKAIHKLENQGIQEVVLTGVHIGDYRDENGKNLEDLLNQLLKNTNIPRIRLTSLEPIEITDRLLESFQNERVCPHFHISLQSTNSQVLKSMKRKYDQQDVEEAFWKISKKVPHSFIGMDIIVGFPSESRKQFEESCRLLENHHWTNIHVFPYSPRKGTYSALKYEALDQKEVSERADILRHISQNRFQKQMNQQKGTRKKTLLFKTDNQKSLSRDYWKIKVPPSNRKGEQEVLIKGVNLEKSWLEASWV